MATLGIDGELDLAALRGHLAARLPHYARPLFLRIRNEMEVTATFKYKKADLVRQGYDPAATSDAIYFDCAERDTFVRLESAVYDRIQLGLLHLDHFRPGRREPHSFGPIQPIQAHGSLDADPA
jgi:fatty-acyl-CoA synthase